LAQFDSVVFQLESFLGERKGTQRTQLIDFIGFVNQVTVRPIGTAPHLALIVFDNLTFQLKFEGD
jgi:hypothetical protein